MRSVTAASAESDPPVVLIVDDRPDNLLSLEALLAPLPCLPIRADSGEAALRVLLHREVAVVLLDVQMPGLDGYETARAIKARPRTQALPIIFLSAIDREVEHHLRGYDVGAVDFLSKPLQPEFLIAKVKVFLELYERDRTIRRQARELGEQLEELTAAQRHLDQIAAELERSNGELERFALQVSHTLREPIDIANGLVRVLGMAGGAANPEELLEEAAGCLADVAAMIDDAVELARAGLAYGTVQATDLEGVVANVRRRLAEELRRVDLPLTADPLPTVVADPNALEQALTSIIRSSCRRADEDTRSLHVGVSRRDGMWVIAVADDGPSPPPAELPRMLSLLGRPSGDAGAALALARRVIERHGGSMWAEASPGRGTTIAFTLPAQA